MCLNVVTCPISNHGARYILISEAASLHCCLMFPISICVSYTQLSIYVDNLGVSLITHYFINSCLHIFRSVAERTAKSETGPIRQRGEEANSNP